MNKQIFHFLATIVVLLITISLHAQNLDSPGDYMSYMSKSEKELGVKYLSYMSASSHGKSMKKVDKRRADLLNSIYEVRIKLSDMPSFNSDKSLRDAGVNYLKIMYSVFNEDYGKLVNMEEIAEQSYDNMEAYLLAQEKANEKLKEASMAYSVMQKEFAKTHNVNLMDSESELGRKLEEAEKVSEYYHQIYLLFFKSNKQETYLLDAFHDKNINAIEQNKNTLIKYANEGIEKIRSMKGYEGDKSLEAACRKVLEFFKDEAEKKIPALSDFLIGTENFEQIKKAFEAQNSTQRTKQDVDNYNKAVAAMNKGADTYNSTHQQLNTNRSNAINNYNEAVQNFMNTHMPYAR